MHPTLQCKLRQATSFLNMSAHPVFVVGRETKTHQEDFKRAVRGPCTPGEANELLVIGSSHNVQRLVAAAIMGRKIQRGAMGLGLARVHDNGDIS